MITYTLKTKPELTFEFEVNHFSITDDGQPQNNGSYTYNKLKKIELQKEQNEYGFSSIIWILEQIISAGLLGKLYKTKSYLILNLGDKSIKIWLKGVSIKKVKHMVSFMHKKNPHSAVGV